MFFSIIMCCYILLLCYLKIEEKHPKVCKLFNFGGLFPLIVFCILAIVNIQIEGILAFLIGFNLKRNKKPAHNDHRNFLIAIATFCSAIGIRLISKYYLDETVIHNNITSRLSHLILAAFFIGVKWLFDAFPNLMNRIASSRFFCTWTKYRFMFT